MTTKGEAIAIGIAQMSTVEYVYAAITLINPTRFELMLTWI